MLHRCRPSLLTLLSPALLSLVLLAASACYSVDYPARHYCKTDPTCPPGHSCRNGVCVLEGTRLDGGADQALDAAPDAAPDVAPHDDKGADLATPDDAAPDQAAPDQGLPDKGPPLPDLPVPKVLFEDNFNDNKLDLMTWKYWRMSFKEQNSRLEVESKPRTGFSYGHSANGRGALLMTHINDTTWKDYRVELEIEALVPGVYNQGTPSCYRSFGIYFRVQKATESWNDAAGNTYYGMGVVTNTCNTYKLGDWSLARTKDFYYPGTGWSTTHMGTHDRIFPATGVANSPLFVNGANKLAVEVRTVSGDVNIKVFVFDNTLSSWKLVTDQTDASGQGLLHGGIGFSFGWEDLGWLDNVKVTAL